MVKLMPVETICDYQVKTWDILSDKRRRAAATVYAFQYYPVGNLLSQREQNKIKVETVCGYPLDVWNRFTPEKRRVAAEIFIMQYEKYGIDVLINELSRIIYFEDETVCGYPLDVWNGFTPEKREGFARIHYLGSQNASVLINELIKS